ncbi:MAG: MFS transporter [Dethiosulfovibrio peptidovorans]|nr:MAG: MFS transporter [Dethiosulfovibrio peptidovorans]
MRLQQDRYILLVLSFSLFCCMLGVGVISPILPLYAVQLGAGGGLLGLVLGIFSLSRLGCSLVAGGLADRLERKYLILFGLSVYTLSSVAYLAVTSVWHMVAIRFFNGMGSAFVIPVAMSIGSDVSKKGGEGKFFGFLQMALFAGIGTGPLISGLMADWLGLQAPFLVMTSLTLMALVGVAWGLPTGLPVSSSSHVGSMKVYRALLRDPVLCRVYVYQFSSALGRGSMLMFLPLIASEAHLTFFKIGVVLSIVSLTTGFLQRFTGLLADRMPKNRLVWVGGTITSGILFMMPAFRSFPSLLLGALIFGLGAATSSPSIISMAAIRGRVFGTGRTMGMFNIAFGLGMTLGPLLAGYIREVGILSSPFVPIGGILLGCTSLFIFDHPFRGLDDLVEEGGPCV